MFLRFRKIASFLAAAAFLAASPVASAQEEGATADRSAEYMIYQYPAVSLVVVIDTRETEFGARITGPEGAPVSETGISSRRIGPVYQFVEAVNTPRQLMIEVNPARRIERSRISMELLQLPETDRNARALAAAYRFLAHGMKRVYTDNTTVWAERTYALRNAAQAFASLGMEEMRLWSEYYAAHLVLYEINDVLMAMERAQAIRAANRKAGFETIELVTLMLEADALMMAGDLSSGSQAFGRYESAHEKWESVALLAGELGYEAERGRALYNDGMAYERQDRLDRAIERYEQALDVTASASDPELLNQVRATAAAAYEARGSTSGAISLLEDIAGDLSDDGEQSASLELAANLYETGRLLNRTFRYNEAAEELQQALELQKENLATGQWGRTGLELGWSYYSLGYLETAGSVIRESLPRTPWTEKRLLARAYGVLADISKEKGSFEQMAEYRGRQGGLLESDAERPAFLFESAADALHRDGSGSAESGRLLRQAQQLASGSDLLTRHRAVLYLCLQELLRQGRAACDLGRARSSQEVLQNSGIPFIEVDSGLTWVRILRHKGYVSEAREQVDHLVDDVQFYRERLPGVLAAWHWQKREGLYQEYMELALASRAGKGEGEALLLALERIRSLERVVSTGAEAEDGIRNQVARVKAAQPAPGNEPSRQAASVLTAFREGSGWSSGALSSETLTARLEKLGRHDSVLAFYFSDSSVYAVSANRREIRRFQLAGTARIREQIAAVMAAIDNPTGTVPLAGLERLGGLLLEPMARHLGERIFFLSSGPLLGLPLDALRLDGSYLAEVRRVVNLDSLDAMTTPGTELSGGFRDHVFLAGNPRAGRDLFSYGVATSEEIDAVRDAFVGDGLHIVQGVALRGDEFLDERYGNAGLVHLAMPGRIDLVHPERSSLLLSGERESPTTEFLSPARVRGIGLEAQLVVLSGTSFTGRTITDFDSRIGLVSDLQAAGAGLVLATVWPAGDAETARFMSDFYSALEREADVSEALFQTRKARIASKTETNLRSWAGFQLFIR